ncbi:DUF190 domain-containing protein [Streptomyces pactum]|uniref:DUF190 domain-containing protein n=1 Tax=Streptomyces pactum TaxID=68249 RepID=A0ABS0NIP7_9ACTN|nr:DUF190 domain-containing protein [Streptomyces pactum]
MSGVAGLRLTVLVLESDVRRHRPLYSEIVHLAHRAGLRGASVFRGVEGFGASSRIHTTRLLSLSEELPVAVVVIDTEERVRAFLPELTGLLGNDGLITVEPVEVITGAADGPEPDPAADREPFPAEGRHGGADPARGGPEPHPPAGPDATTDPAGDGPEPDDRPGRAPGGPS